MGPEATLPTTPCDVKPSIELGGRRNDELPMADVYPFHRAYAGGVDEFDVAGTQERVVQSGNEGRLQATLTLPAADLVDRDGPGGPDTLPHAGNETDDDALGEIDRGRRLGKIEAAANFLPITTASDGHERELRGQFLDQPGGQRAVEADSCSSQRNRFNRLSVGQLPGRHWSRRRREARAAQT